MKLNARESILISFLLVVAFAAVGYYYVLTPAMSQWQRRNTELNALADEVLLVEQNAKIFQIENASKDEQAQTDIAQNSYASFYSKINSYNIDTIMRELIDKHKLVVSRMSITPYTQVAYTEIGITAEQLAGNPVSLLRSDVALSLSGGYPAFLAFVDDLNALGFCVSPNTVVMQKGALPKPTPTPKPARKNARPTPTPKPAAIQQATGEVRAYIYGVPKVELALSEALAMQQADTPSPSPAP